MSYDERQIDKPLTICQKCGHAYYMNHALCAWCGPGWRTVQHPVPTSGTTVPILGRDVMGNIIDGP